LASVGLKTPDELEKPQAQFIPSNTTWIQEYANKIDPEKNLVQLENGQKLTYDYLIVAAGIQVRLDKVKGAIEALDNDPKHVVSIYSRKYVRNVYETFNNFKGGQAIFTFPSTPIKCPGAPQKVLYLAEDLFRRVKIEISV